MTCPKCGSDTFVTYSIADGDSVYRKRKCKKCSHVFYTTEAVAEKSHYKYKILWSEKIRKWRAGK